MSVAFLTALQSATDIPQAEAGGVLEVNVETSEAPELQGPASDRKVRHGAFLDWLKADVVSHSREICS